MQMYCTTNSTLVVGLLLKILHGTQTHHTDVWLLQIRLIIEDCRSARTLTNIVLSVNQVSRRL